MAPKTLRQEGRGAARTPTTPLGLAGQLTSSATHQALSQEWRGPASSTSQRPTTPRHTPRTIDCSSLTISITSGTYNQSVTCNTLANGITRSVNGSTPTVGNTGDNNTRYITHGTLTIGNIQNKAPAVGIAGDDNTRCNTCITTSITSKGPDTQRITYGTLGIP